MYKLAIKEENGKKYIKNFNAKTKNELAKLLRKYAKINKINFSWVSIPKNTTISDTGFLNYLDGIKETKNYKFY